jgi:hypothetical protein
MGAIEPLLALSLHQPQFHQQLNHPIKDHPLGFVLLEPVAKVN